MSTSSFLVVGQEEELMTAMANTSIMVAGGALLCLQHWTKPRGTLPCPKLRRFQIILEGVPFYSSTMKKEFLSLFGALGVWRGQPGVHSEELADGSGCGGASD